MSAASVPPSIGGDSKTELETTDDQLKEPSQTPVPPPTLSSSAAASPAATSSPAASSPASAAPPTPGMVYVVADSSGFVGAFTERADAARLAAEYPEIPLIIYEYRVGDIRSTHVFIIPYKGSDAIAFVSDDEHRCRTVHAALNLVGLVYDDDVAYWRHPVNVPCTPAIKRMKVLVDGARKFGGSSSTADTLREDAEAKEKALFEEHEGPLQRLLRESERITIFDCVVPTELGGGGGDGSSSSGCSGDRDACGPPAAQKTGGADDASADSAAAELTAADVAPAAAAASAEPTAQSSDS